jgi:hypothetical protein
MWSPPRETKRRSEIQFFGVYTNRRQGCVVVVAGYIEWARVSRKKGKGG